MGVTLERGRGKHAGSGKGRSRKRAVLLSEGQVSRHGHRVSESGIEHRVAKHWAGPCLGNA